VAHLTTSNTSNSYHCDYCHKDGHTEVRSYKKKRDKRNGSSSASVEIALCVYETALIMRAKEEGYINDMTFIADTGTSSHMVHTKKYLTGIQSINSEVTMRSEQMVPCTEKGTYRGFLKNKFGKHIPICLQNVCYVTQLTANLLSITRCTSQHGVYFTAKNNRMYLNIKGQQIKFEKELMHGSGKLYATDIIPLSNEAAYLI
jgi:hypothetical protein